MKHGLAFLAAILVLTLGARASDFDLAITADAKRVSSKEVAAGAPKTHMADELQKSQTWGYAVTLENKTLKPLQGLEVHYIIFSKHEQLGIKGPPKKEQLKGTYPLPTMPALSKTTFDTQSVVLKRASIIGPVGGYSYFTNGAKAKVEDRLSGIWIRVFQGGKVFAEFATPSGLTSSETWPE